MNEGYKIAKTFLKYSIKSLGSSNENKQHMAFSEPEHNAELSLEVTTSVIKRSSFFTDVQKIHTDDKYQISDMTFVHHNLRNIY